MRLKVRDIFTKQMLLFLGILLGFCILGAVFYISAESNIKSKTLQFNQFKAASFLDMVEKDLEGIRQIQGELIYDRDLQRIVADPTTDQFEQYTIIWNIQDKLYTMKISSYIDSVLIDIPSLDLVIGTDITDEKIDQMVRGHYAARKDERIELLNDIDGQLLMVQTWPVYTRPGDPGNQFSVIIKLSRDKLMQDLNNFRANGDLCCLLGTDGRYAVMPAYDHFTEGDAYAIESGIARENKTDGIGIGKDTYDAIVAASDDLGMKLLYLANRGEYESARSGFAFQYWIFYYAVTFLFAVIFFMVSSRLIRKPLSHLVKGLGEIEKGNYAVRLSRSVRDNIAYIYESFNNMASEIQRLIEKEYKQRLLAQESHLQYLQAQIKPHFLYNCFFNMANMLELERYEQLGAFIRNLGRFYHYVHGNWKESGTLLEEADHARSYAEIQKLRFGMKVDIRIGCVPEAWQALRVPCLMIQPLIENSFEHGFKRKEGLCVLAVEFNERPGGLEIAVLDNGAGMGADQLRQYADRMDSDPEGVCESHALLNIHRRLRLFFSGRGRLRLENVPGGGFMAVIEIDREGAACID